MDLKEALRGYLRASREALLWKLDGLSEREVRLPHTPTGTNLLGLVKHCALVEHGYFGECLGRDPGVEVPVYDYEADPNADFYATAEESMASVLALYARVADYVDATVTELPLDAPARVSWWGERGETDLGRLLVHVLSDLARHAGHADIIREDIDGRTGLRPGAGNPGEPAQGWDAYREDLVRIAESF